MSELKSICCVARDFAPSESLNFLAGLLRQQGHVCKTFFGKGKDINATDEKISAAAHSADALVLGMAHSPDAARQEILAGLGAGDKAKLVLWVDSFFCSGRDWFAPLRERVDLVLVCAEPEASRARQCFPNATVVATGNPLWEQNYFAAIEAHASRQEIRDRLGVAGSDILCWICLRKEREINEAHLGAIAGVWRHLSDEVSRRLQFRVTTHSGEPDAETGLRKYREIIGSRASFKLAIGEEIACMLAACDVVFSAGSGVGVEALSLERPVIEFLPNLVLDELGRLQSGNRLWQPVEDGVALAVVNSAEMAEVICKHGQETEHLRERQRIFYPAPSHPGAAINKMADEIRIILE